MSEKYDKDERLISIPYRKYPQEYQPREDNRFSQGVWMVFPENWVNTFMQLNPTVPKSCKINLHVNPVEQATLLAYLWNKYEALKRSGSLIKDKKGFFYCTDTQLQDTFPYFQKMKIYRLLLSLKYLNFISIEYHKPPHNRVKGGGPVRGTLYNPIRWVKVHKKHITNSNLLAYENRKINAGRIIESEENELDV